MDSITEIGKKSGFRKKAPAFWRRIIKAGA
jgi:hypothetical protein